MDPTPPIFGAPNLSMGVGQPGQGQGQGTIEMGMNGMMPSSLDPSSVWSNDKMQWSLPPMHDSFASNAANGGAMSGSNGPNAFPLPPIPPLLSMAMPNNSYLSFQSNPKGNDGFGSGSA